MQALCSSLYDQVNSTGDNREDCCSEISVLNSGVLLVTAKMRRGRENEENIKYRIFFYYFGSNLEQYLT